MDFKIVMMAVMKKTVVSKMLHCKIFTKTKYNEDPTNCIDIITNVAKELFTFAWSDNKPIRLLGIGVSNFEDETKSQVELF